MLMAMGVSRTDRTAAGRCRGRPAGRLAAAGVAVLLSASALGCGRAGGAPSPAVAQPPPPAGPAAADRPADTGTPPPGWAAVETLIEERRYRAALELVAEMRRRAEAGGDEAEWARALVREIELLTGLDGFETAVGHLREAAWPPSPVYRTVLELYYARTLTNYLQVYGWQIANRESVASADELDLRQWSRERILAEIDTAFERLWQRRQAWGARPLGALAEFFEAGGYPTRVRGTLRDAVSYLWAEQLADSSWWSPAESNRVHRLELTRLIGGAPAAAGEHPLARLAAVLGDLEAWHRAAGRPAAAFEARRERLALLWVAFDRDDDREKIRGALEAALDRLGRGDRWWSFGQAQLAEWLEQGTAPDALVRARLAALAGVEAHPGSLGGRRCRQIVAAIEAPDYQLAAMASDGLGRRSIEVSHRNLEALWFRAYRLDPMPAIEAAAPDRFLLPGAEEAAELLAAGEPVAEWRVELPPTPDFRQRTTYVVPAVDRPGLYLVAVSARRDFAETGNRRAAVRLVLGDLVLVTRPLADRLEVEVRSGAGGGPLTGVDVRLYRYDWQNGHRLAASRRSDEAGIAVFDRGRWRRGGYFLLARRGDELALETSYLDLGRRRPPRQRPAALVFTDRTVYRPGQSVLWKIVAYGGDGESGRFATLADRRLTVELVDANGEVVAERAVVTNPHGTASGEFELPYGRLLGGWWLRTSLGGGSGIRVEEYKRPTFEVTIAEPAAALRLNRPAELTGEARYYFGLPVSAGRATWRVTREPLPAPWRHWIAPPVPAPAETVAAGEASLAPDGSFTVAFTPEADERAAAEGASYHYRLSVEVTDEGGETRSAERGFRLGFAAVEAEIELAGGFQLAGEPAFATVHRRDLDGAPRAGGGSWRLLEVDQPARALLPAEQPLPPEGAGDARLRPRWDPGMRVEAVMAGWPDGGELLRGELEHGDGGAAQLRLPALSPGVYRLRYETRDAWGVAAEAARELVVAAPGRTPLALPAVLRAERGEVAVGDSLRLLVHSALPGQQLVLELLRGHRRLERRVLDSAAGAHVVELPITAEHRGGLGVRLTALRDHQLMALTTAVTVPWDDKRLGLGFATFRDRLEPGGRERWRVTVRGADEAALAAGAAELLAYMYDRSLDLFAPHSPPDPLALYPVWGAPTTPLATLGSAGEMWRDGGWRVAPDAPRPGADRLRFLPGGGIGGPGRVGGPPPAAPLALRHQAPILMEAAADEARASGLVAAEKPPAGEPAPPRELRSEFAETAFWLPHLVLGADGAVAFEFTVPDSVTEWTVWVHAITRDLAAGSLSRQARSLKELMVRPYLPRFLRQGDRAVVQVVVNNATAGPLAGTLDFDLRDPDSGASLLAEFGVDPETAAAVPFEVAAGGTTELAFELTAPVARLGEVAVRAEASAGELSDGELRPLPLLPGRLQLAQSRFAALTGGEQRRLELPDLAAAAGDPGLVHERLVVTLDGQLFTSVLRSLPYLVDYPFECTEQTLNRFLSAGILAEVYGEHPAVARLARRLADRDSRFEPWEAADPNRRMALEETPWRVAARGGSEPSERLVRLLEPRVARGNRRAALARLARSQAAAGGFPWWPGGPPSPYMTLYVLSGLARALEFGVEVPKELSVRGWSYLDRQWRDELSREPAGDCCWQLVTYLNYVLSAYPDDSWTGGVFSNDDRQRMLEASYRRWRDHPPLLKGYLALTLTRAGRRDDAMRVFESLLDSARTDPDLGTYWAPEERAWLWYNDTVEGHAFALRTLTELAPDDPRRHGLVQWLMLNKQLNHWKSTRATAEVVYALVHHLEREGLLGQSESATVNLGPRSWTVGFAPDELAPAIEPPAPGGQPNQIVVPGPEVDPATMASVVVRQHTRALLFASVTWQFSTDRLPAEARGDLFRVERRYYRRRHDGREWRLEPLGEGDAVAVGDGVEVQLSISARHAAEYVHLRDPRGAGFEPESLTSGYRWDQGLGRYEEVRDSGTSFFFDWLPAGEYTLRYRLRAATAGSFRAAPAVLQSMYAPEFTAYSAGARLRVE